MHTSTTLTVLAHLLVSSTNAQNTSTSTCSDIEDAVRYNSSSTRSIQPYFIAGQQADRGTFRLMNDSEVKWELSLRVQPMEDSTFSPGASSPNYQQRMFLDTGNSNMTHIGACHHTIQPSINGVGFSWTKEAVQRSLDDNGDCSVLLGSTCIEALRKKFRDEAAMWPLRTGSCRGMNNTMPEECAGSGFGPQLFGRQMNTTYFNNETAGNLNANFPTDLECNGINASSTHSLVVAERMSYDDAVRFPVIDVISFFPNRSSGLGLYVTQWNRDVQIEISCMKADGNIVEGSTVPPSAKDLIESPQAKFPTTSGAGSMGLPGWMGAVVLGVIMVL